MIEIPEPFRAMIMERPAWAEWLADLPRLLAALVEDWELRPDGAAWSGECAVVAPVRTADGRRAALKVGWPHWEAETEHLALRAWGGDGAIELWRADPRRFALLLERADGSRDLSRVPVLEACEIVAGLYPRLHVPALPQLRRLSELCREWEDRMGWLGAQHRAPRRYVDRARALLRAYADDPATDGRLIHTDLHYTNVLAGEREPWLVIDPKPLSGDPCYEVAPLLWNRWDEVTTGGTVRAAVLDRLLTVVDMAELDEDRARDWVVVRMMVNLMWAYEDEDAGTPVPAEWATRCTALVKAVER